MWKLSRYRAGDLVEVGSKEEILATLDARGCVDSLPFMPEMFRFCGRRFRVRAVAHKTCETAHKTWKGRRLERTVHLADLRCDGSSHGGCEAACTLFWKDVWLKPVGTSAPSDRANGKPRSSSSGCSEEQLVTATQLPIVAPDANPCYACQATLLYGATELLPWWDVRQYVFDVMTGNHSAGRVIKMMWLSTLRQGWRLIKFVPIVRRPYAAVNEWMHKRLTGREAPYLFKKVKPCIKTPTGRLDLKAGEMVRVKSKAEIEATIDAKGLNRGLSFDPEEMARYCGQIFRVRRSVTKILDEATGEMIHMKQPCIILEGAVCQSEYCHSRLNCPRAIPSFWRELWLERIQVSQSNEQPMAEAPEAALVESAS
jgi:hypothetical protein